MALIKSIVLGRASGAIGGVSYTPFGRSSMASAMQQQKINTSSIDAKNNRLGFKNCVSVWYLIKNFLSGTKYFVSGRRSRYNLYVSNCISAFPDYKVDFFDLIIGALVNAKYRGSEIVKINSYYWNGSQLIINYTVDNQSWLKLAAPLLYVRVISLNKFTRSCRNSNVRIDAVPNGQGTLIIDSITWENSIYGCYIYSVDNKICSDITFKEK